MLNVNQRAGWDRAWSAVSSTEDYRLMATFTALVFMDYSGVYLELFHPAGMTCYTDRHEIWHGETIDGLCSRLTKQVLEL